MKKLNICIIEDEEILRVSLKDDLLDAGYIVNDFENPLKAIEHFKKKNCDIVISDIRLPEMNGLDLLSEIKSLNPNTFVIIMTAFGSVETAVEAMKKGAYDYITKPFDKEELLLIINRIKEVKALQSKNLDFQKYFQDQFNFDAFIGKSSFVSELKEALKIISQTNSIVLITGETGTGKELIANLIHYNSPRRDKPLVKVSCGILSKEVIESELFGHEKGAFTGAEKLRIGRFEKADQGTIYLDDIDDVPLEVQIKLLRVIQEQEIERVGSSESIKIDVKIIASTKADLKKLVLEGKFREDLYYRLNVLPIHLKPLRERKEDIILLFDYFFNRFSNQKQFEIENNVYEILKNYHWPGNVREIKNLAERLSILCYDSKITTDRLPQEIISNEQIIGNILKSENKSLTEILEEVEKQLIQNALIKSGNNKAKAAEFLGLPPSTLKSKIEKFGMN
ncbi:sigma-54-dependent transcriptional regulator [Stygiobacter electus]|uniref:Sigma-54 dependent transcriptional regulator n=1 Tax=Stygiobacter electus TaxID=3032292 RepID=A0AAE3P1J2_9BACT|nr:sigma-54 dependent transcriptional regulator [Stygiobacter electus]MDF1612545.1 sigma-54 dependent transcriptional regulator [Stygiobacter electus]